MMEPGPHRSSSAPVVVAKLVGVFAVIGAGLGIGTVLFLWASGVFDAQKQGLESIGEAIAGGLIVSASLVFALLFGVVFSAVAGMHAATDARDRVTAAFVGGVASAVGQIALIVALGAVLIGGINFFEASPREASSASPTPTAESCRTLFGTGPEFCPERDTAPTETEDGEEAHVSVRDLSRLALGAVPAFVVGALSGALVFTRRRRDA